MSTTSEAELKPSIGRILGKRAVIYLCLVVFAFALLLLINTGNASAAGPTYVYTDITSDTTWTADNSPYIVNQSISIVPGVTLTIEPNVTVMVDNGVGITISGTLIADGTADQPITFTSNGSTSWGAWDGLFFDDTSTGSVIDNVIIEYAYDPIYIFESSVAISNVQIYGYEGSWPFPAAIQWISTGDIVTTISNVEIRNGTYSGIAIFSDEGAVDVTLNNIVVDNSVSATPIVARANHSVDMVITGVEMSDIGWRGILLESDSGNVNLQVTDVIADSLGYTMLALWAHEGDINVVMTNALLNDTSGNEMYADGSVNIQFIGVDITNCWGDALYVRASEGGAAVTLEDMLVEDTTGGDAVYIEANLTVDLTVIGANFIDVDGYGFYLESDSGDVSVDLQMVTLSNIVVSAISISGTAGTVSAEITDSEMEMVGNSAIEVAAGNGISLLSSDLTVNDTGNGIELVTVSGSVTAEFTNLTLTNSYENGIYIWAPLGDVTLTVDPSVISFCDYYGIYVESGGLADVLLVDTEVSYCYYGVYVSGDLRATVELDNSVLTGHDVALYEYANMGNVELTVVSGMVNDSETGLWLESFDGNVMAQFDGANFAGNYYSIGAFTYSKDVNMSFESCYFDGDFDTSVYVESMGELNLQVFNTTMNGYSANAAGWYYFNEIEYEYEIIDPDSHTSASYFSVSLPFSFPFAGSEYNQIWVYKNGYISLGSYIGIYSSINFYSWYGAPVIVPCVHTFYTNVYPEYGYKVYEDRVVIQWDVYYDYNSLRNVFEVILYENGDIQFNYDEMESLSHSVYDYGLMIYPGYSIDVGQIWKNSDPFDNDFTSLYFTHAPMSYGVAIYGESSGDLNAQLAGNTISNYFTGGVVLFADEGAVRLEVENNSFANIYGEIYSEVPFGGITAFAAGNTIEVNCQDNEFSNIVTIGAAFVSSPWAGGTDTFYIVNNTFQSVSTASIGAVTIIEDDYGDDEVIYQNTKTIKGNIGTDSAGILAIMEIYVEGSPWDITVTEDISDNEFTGYNIAYFTGFLQPEMDMANMVGSYFNLWADSNCTVNRTVEIYDNLITAMLIPYLYGGGVIASNGITVSDTICTEGATITSSHMIDVHDNILTGEIVDFRNGISVMIGGTDFYGGDGITDYGQLDMVVNVDINNNVVYSPEEGDNGIYVGAYIDNGYSDRNEGTGTMNATIVIQENTVTNFDEGIYEWSYFYLYNDWADINAAVDVVITDNSVENCEYGIDAEDWIEVGFSYYFPEYEEEVWSSAEFDMSYQIMDNTVSASTETGIYFYHYSYAWEDYVGTFSNARAEGTVDLVISGNDVSSTYYGMEIYVEDYAESGSIADTETSVEVTGNTVTGVDEYYGYTEAETGIYLGGYYEAWAYNMEMDDSPVVSVAADMVITNNVVENFEYGIEAYVYLYSEYGLSSLDASINMDISNNEIVAAYDGIDAELYGNVYQWSGYGEESNATMSVEAMLTVTENTITGVEEDGMLYIDDDGIYVDAWFDEYVVGTVEIQITGNTITGGDIDDGYGIEVYGSDYTQIITFNILDNTIDSIYEGIYADTANVYIAGNTITNVYYGMEFYYVQGIVEENVISDAYQGFYLDECFDLVIQDNIVTTTFGSDSWDGADIYDSINITLQRNMIDGFGYGVYLDYVDESIFSDNSVTNSVWTAVDIEWCDDIEVSGNLIENSYEDGLYLYRSESILIENNIITGHQYNGIYMGQYNYNVVIGNNTISNVGEDGLYIYMSYNTKLYNNVFVDCGDYAVYGHSYQMSWIIDSEAEVRNCGVYFRGDVTVMEGGTFNLDSVQSFIMSDDYDDGIPAITVEEGGVLQATNTEFDGSTYLFEVYGEMYMDNSEVFDAYQLYLAPSSTVEIHSSIIAYNELNGVFIDDCSPVIVATEIRDNDGAGIYISGENAAPEIKDCEITENERGIYAYEASLGQVVDNLIFDNEMAGIYVEQVTGAIHDNIVMFNQREIFIKNSDVTLMDNQIGYSTIIEIMAEYWPLMLGGYEGLPDGYGSGVWYFTPEQIMSMLSNHIGVYVDSSAVSMSGNVYGLLSYAVYAVGSEIGFSDSVEMNTLTLSYFDEFYTMYNITLPIFVYDGLFASDSSVTISGAYIEVLDDAVFLEGCEAVIQDTEMVAGDFDIYAMGGSMVDAFNPIMEKARAEDTSEITVWYTLTVYTVDQDGNPAANISVTVMNAEEQVVDESASGSDGVFQTCVVAAHWTSAGKDTSMNPYTVVASFDDENVTASVGIGEPMEITLQEPPEEPWDATPAFATAFGAVILGVILIALIESRP